MTNLNFDILPFVIAHLASHDALRMSTLCKAIHNIAVRRAITAGVIIKGLRRASKFVHFMLADRVNRVSLLRSLTLEGDTQEFYNLYGWKVHEHDAVVTELLLDHFADFLQNTLTQYHYLQYLSLPYSFYFLERNPHLRESLISYDGLIELTLHNVTREVLQVVKVMHSTLYALSLFEHTHSFESRYSSSPFPALACLTTHQQLRKLVLSTDLARPSSWNSGGRVRWDAIQELEIQQGRADLSLLMDLFPCLRSLRIDCLYCESPNSTVPPAAYWTSLDYLCGDYENLCSCPVQCTVRWLELSSAVQKNPSSCWVSRRSPPDVTIADLMKSTRPMILTLVASCNASQGFWEDLVSAAQHIKLLELTVRFELSKDEVFKSSLFTLVAKWMVCSLSS